MCDYSLEAYRSRPAQVSEQYVTHRFSSGTIGFIAPGDPQTAICMACDMRLSIDDIPADIQTAHKVGPKETVTFVRLERGPFFDGVRFANGAEVTLQRLGAGAKCVLIEPLDGKTIERRTPVFVSSR